MYFLYIVGSSFATCSTIVPSIIMCMHSFMLACRNAPGMSATATYRPYLASMQHDIIIASSDTVGELASPFSVYCHCGHPSAHPLAFTAPSLFSLMNIRYRSALCLSSADISSLRIGTIAFLSCSCHNSFDTASSPLLPNFFMPAFTLICVIRTCMWGFSLSTHVDCCVTCIRFSLS